MRTACWPCALRSDATSIVHASQPSDVAWPTSGTSPTQQGHRPRIGLPFGGVQNLTKVPNQRRKFAQRFSRRADARLQPFPFRPPTSSYTPMCKAAERTNGVEVRPHRLLSHRNFSADRSASLFPVAAGAIHEWALLLEWQQWEGEREGGGGEPHRRQHVPAVPRGAALLWRRVVLSHRHGHAALARLPRLLPLPADAAAGAAALRVRLEHAVVRALPRDAAHDLAAGAAHRPLRRGARQAHRVRAQWHTGCSLHTASRHVALSRTRTAAFRALPAHAHSPLMPPCMQKY